MAAGLACCLLAALTAASPEPKDGGVRADAGVPADEGIDFDTLVDAMTIDDLLTVPVAGTLAASRRKVSPVSVTVITADDIRRTPARNVMDLLEVYVPGALFMHHSDGLQYGLRGIVNDRKNKILVLVNGRDVGIKAHGGDTADTEAWDLADIEKIEIIRGPGSVTYGPGAIAGVINITTKSGETAPGARAWTSYLSSYNSIGGGVSYGGEKGPVAYYFYAGLSYSGGVERPRAFDVRSNGAFGYVGFPADQGGIDTIPSNEYYSTLRAGRSSPLVKAGLNLKLGEHWRVWARYVESGSAFSPQPKAQLGGVTNTPLRQEYVVGNSRENRQLMATVENDAPVTSFMAIKSAAGFMSSDSEIRAVRSFSSDPQNGSNFLLNFAEHTGFVRSVASFAFLETYSVAVGGEYRYTAWTPGWGDRAQSFVMGDNQNIVNGRDSDRVITQGVNPATLIMAGNTGWAAHWASAIGEANLGFHRLFTVLVSARYDYNTYSVNDLFSPRVAIVSDFERFGLVKLIAQRSLRMSNADVLYEQKALGHPPQTERLQGIEAAYDFHAFERKLNLVVTGFLDDLQILSWDSVARTTQFTGNGQLWGAEAEVKFTNDFFSIGLNHSVVKLLGWRLAKGQTTGGFSYSDMKRTVGNPPVTLGPTGQNINNWSSNTTKLTAVAWLFDRKLELGLDAQFYWGFEGIRDQLAAVEASIVGTTYEARGNEIIAALRQLGAGGPQLRLNASITYRITEGTRVTVYGANLAPFNSKRYYFDSAATGPYPVRVKWIEEPTAFGIRVETNY